MFIFLLGLAVLFVGFRIWRRMEQHDLEIRELSDRIKTLERIPSRADLMRSAPQRVTAPVQPAISRADLIRSAPQQEASAAHQEASAPQQDRSAPHQEGSAPHSAESLETAIGSRWLLYVGVIALIVGISYFEKLAVDNAWIGEGARVMQGGVAGLLLVYAGLRFIRKGYSAYGQMIAGGGIAVQYVSIYAAFNFYHLIDRPLAFGLLLLVTMLAASFADRQRSQGLALMAVGGGFATPFLLPGTTDAQVALFGYDAILILGTMYLARRRDWPFLNVVSYGLTVLTVFAWAAEFYAPSKYLVTELFLTLFCAMYVYVVSQSQKSARTWEANLSSLLWTAPILYYVASICILASHPAGMLVYLLALALTGAFVSARVTGRANAALRLVFWVAAVGPFLQWTLSYAGDDWLTPGLATITAVYLIQLVAHLEATRRDDHRLGPLELVVLHATGLGAFAVAYRLIDAVNVDAVAPAAALFAVWQGAVAFRLWRDREHALHFAALAFTLLMIGIGLQFHGAWVTIGWAAEGAAIIWLGLHERRNWLRAGGLALLAVSAVRLLVLQFEPRSLDQMILLNQPVACGLFVIALVYGLAWLHHRQNQDGTYSLEIGAALVAAQLLTLALATSEIEAYWASETASHWRAARNGPESMVWAAAGGAIAWLGLVRRQRWMRVVGGVLLTMAIALIVLFQIAEAPLTYVVITNFRVMAGVVVIALLYGLARLYRTIGEPGSATDRVYAALVLAANALMLLLLTSEAVAYWQVREVSSLGEFGAEGQFAREMTLSITWALYATALIVAGIRKRYAPIRYLAMGIFAVTIAKVFVFDLPQLGQIYRVLSIIGLGVTLLVSSYLYHRFRSRLATSEPQNL